LLHDGHPTACVGDAAWADEADPAALKALIRAAYADIRRRWRAEAAGG
jgi:hypothetical protein